MDHINASGATRPPMVRTAANPSLEKVVFQRGGIRSVKLDGVLRIFPDRVELLDIHPGGQVLAKAAWGPNEHYRFRQMQAWVELPQGFRVMWNPEEVQQDIDQPPPKRPRNQTV